jgi:hypothetical protein
MEGCPSLAYGGPTVAAQLHVIEWLSLENSFGGDRRSEETSP